MKPPRRTAGLGVRRTLTALELLAAAPVTTSELSEALSVDPRTARALLDWLVVEGYAIRRVRRWPRYVATRRLADVGASVARQLRLPEAADVASR